MMILHVLLPSRERANPDQEAQRWLLRGDRMPDDEAGQLPALRALFSWPGASLPAAALMRQHVAGDAAHDTWLCAEPGWVEVDINGARMMACGNLDLTQDEAERFASPLRPVLGDAGALLELSLPNRWHLRLADDAPLPDFLPPDRVLGVDLLPCLEGDGPMRHWRHLFNAVQTELHGNPANAARRDAGCSPFNALWFWGGGRLPAWVKTPLQRVFSDDPLVQALAARTAADAQPLAAFDECGAADGEVLLDLGQTAMAATAWQGLLDLLGQRASKELRLYFSDGQRYRLRRAQRWRLWRRHE